MPPAPPSSPTPVAPRVSPSFVRTQRRATHREFRFGSPRLKRSRHPISVLPNPRLLPRRHFERRRHHFRGCTHPSRGRSQGRLAACRRSVMALESEPAPVHRSPAESADRPPAESAGRPPEAEMDERVEDTCVGRCRQGGMGLCSSARAMASATSALELARAMASEGVAEPVVWAGEAG